MPVPRLDPQRSAVLLIDLQERLMPVMHGRSQLERRAARLLEGANALKVPVLVTEQYPRGLGATVTAVSQHLSATVYRDQKTRFSACSESLLRFLRKFEIRSVVLGGIEAHVCLLQTCLDLLDERLTVAVCHDATSSRRASDKEAALQRMTQAGALPTTVEAALLELVADADTEGFRAIRRVIQSKDA